MLTLRRSPLPAPPALILLAPLLAVGTGCTHNVFSPPARALPLETAATLPEGDTGVQLEGGQGGALFGPDLAFGSARVRHGLTGDLDLDVDATLIRVTNGDSAVDVSRNIYAVRGGVKARLVSALSLAAGLGGGYSAAGAFVSPDMGPILAWENPYAVPFLTGRVGFSQPISPRPVDTSSASDGPGAFVETPRTTWIVTVAGGIRVPIGWAEHPAGTTRGSLLAGLGFTHLADTRDKETYSQLALGGELVF
jgi:hypothetical protein